MIKEVEGPTLKDLFGSYKESNDLADMRFVGSGKGAMAVIFKYLRDKNIIENKVMEVMVPDWLGFWVYNQIQAFAFPAKKVSDRTRAIFVYHQYGFPQDMDTILDFARTKKLIVIEDCAHALESSYKGKIVGSFGDFSIYSFSKWFFCFALGGVRSKFDDFDLYAQKVISETPFGLTFIKDLAKLKYECVALSNSHLRKKYLDLFVRMTYSIYGDAIKPGGRAVYLAKSKMRNEINIRKARYKYFREKTDRFSICDHLEQDGIAPYVIPIRASEQRAQAIVDALREKKIGTGIYNFDINRNLLSPKFVPCIWIPCHGAISENIFNSMIETISEKFHGQ